MWYLLDCALIKCVICKIMSGSNVFSVRLYLIYYIIGGSNGYLLDYGWLKCILC